MNQRLISGYPIIMSKGLSEGLSLSLSANLYKVWKCIVPLPQDVNTLQSFKKKIIYCFIKKQLQENGKRGKRQVRRNVPFL